jgi:uncharacterized integral membrane protein (TIGR00697 family)
MNTTIKGYEYLVLIAMIYMAIDLTSMVFAYKIIEIGPLVGAASSLIFPLTYSIMDVTAEVYSFQTAKKIIYFGLACDFIFAILVYLISQIPSSDSLQTIAYVQVLGQLVRAVVAQTIGVLTGAIINVYLLSKWKIMTNGRHLWLRSAGSSLIGEAIMLVISVSIALIGVLTLSQIFHLILFTYLYKVVFAFAISPLVSISAAFLKNKIGNIQLVPQF